MGDAGDKKRARGNVPCLFEECRFETAKLLREAGDSLGFGVEDVEDRQQLGDLQDFLEFAAQVTKAQSSAL